MKEALKLALEALEADELDMVDDGSGNMVFRKEQAITAIKEALAQPYQEPVAWATKEDFYRELEHELEHIREEMKIKSVTMRCKDYDIALPIIATDFGRVWVGQVSTPPQRKPLTDEQIEEIAEGYLVDYRIPAGCAWNFARDIEAAHGIKG